MRLLDPILRHRFALAIATCLALMATAGAETLRFPHNPTGTEVIYMPSVVSSLHFDQVETGISHTVARVGGNVYTWGQNNDQGQLGRGGALTVPTRITDFRDENNLTVTPIPTIAKIASGDNFCLALDTAGKIYHWGDLPGSPHFTQPRREWFSTVVTDIAAGGEHGLVYGVEGSERKIRGFGNNVYGQAVGYPTGGAISFSGAWPLFGTNSNTAKILAPPNTELASIACGKFHSVVVLANGTVRAFGNNAHGELGLGNQDYVQGFPTYWDFVTSTKSTGVDFTDGVQADAGNGFTIIRDSDDHLYSAGINTVGQIGRGGDHTRYGQVNIDGVVDFSAGYNSAIVSTLKRVFTWGFKVIGDNTAVTQSVPTSLGGFSASGPVEAGNFEVPTTGPWGSIFFNNGLGTSIFVGAGTPAPHYQRTELYTSDGVRAGGGFTGGQSGFVRIYTNVPAANGNGPLLTPIPNSENFSFGPGQVVPDGSDHVDIAITTIPVEELDDAPFDVEENGIVVATGKHLRVFPPMADTITISNVSRPGRDYRAGDVVRFDVTLPFPAPLSGYEMPFTTTAPAIIPDGFIPIAPGGNVGTFETVIPAVNNGATMRVTVVNQGRPNAVATMQVRLPMIQRLDLDRRQLPGGNSVVLTITLTSQPGPEGVTVNLTSTDAVARFPRSSITLHKLVTPITIALQPVAETRVIGLMATLRNDTRTANVTVRAPGIIGLNGRHFVPGGNSPNYNLLFNAPIPTGGMPVQVTSSHPEVAWMDWESFTATSNPFPMVVHTAPVSEPTEVTFTFTFDGRTFIRRITVNPT